MLHDWIHEVVHIKRTAVERVNSFEFQGVQISVARSWAQNASQRLEKIEKIYLSMNILLKFYW